MTKHIPLELEDINPPELLAEIYEDYDYRPIYKEKTHEKIHRLWNQGERRVVMLSYLSGVGIDRVRRIIADIRKEADDHNLQHSNMRDLQNG